MVEHHSSYLLWARRLRCGAIAGLTSISLIAGESMDVRADWPLSKRKKPVESAEAKQANDFNNAIRKLMAEAKSHADKGELDRAIHLADRAAKISESSANLVRCAPDVSPAATANYVSELRTQRSERLKLRGGSSVSPESLATNQSSSAVTPVAGKAQETRQNKTPTAANFAVQPRNPVGPTPTAKSPQKTQTIAAKPVELPSESALPPLSTTALSPAPMPPLKGVATDLADSALPELSEVAVPALVAASPSLSSSAEELEFAPTTTNPSVTSVTSDSAITDALEGPKEPVVSVAQQKSIDERETDFSDAADGVAAEASVPEVVDTTTDDVAQAAKAVPEQLETTEITQTKDELERPAEFAADDMPRVKLRVRRRETEPSRRPALEFPSQEPDVDQVTAPPDSLADLDSKPRNGGQPEDQFEALLIPAGNDSQQVAPSESGLHSGKLRLRPMRRPSIENQVVESLPESSPSSDLEPTPLAVDSQAAETDQTTEVPVAANDPVTSSLFTETESTDPVEPVTTDSPLAESPAVVEDELLPSVASAGPLNLKLRSRFPVRSSQATDTVTSSKNAVPPRVDTPATATDEFYPNGTSSGQVEHRITPAPEIGEMTDQPQPNEAPAGFKLRARYPERTSTKSDLPVTQHTIKLRKTYDNLSSVTPQSADASSRQSAAAGKSQTSAYDARQTVADEPLSDEAVTEPEPAVQPPSEKSDSLQSAGSTTRPSFRLRKQSVSWDNSNSLPPSGHSSNAMTTGTSPNVAPLPPKSDPVASSSRNRSIPSKASTKGLQSRRDPISMSEGSAASSDEKVPMTSVSPAGNTAAKRMLASFEDDQAELSRTILANGPIQRFAQLFSLPHSTAASTLAVIGIGMLLGGLWLVRATLKISPT